MMSSLDRCTGTQFIYDSTYARQTALSWRDEKKRDHTCQKDAIQTKYFVTAIAGQKPGWPRIT
jgi:hypothetical protein